VAEGKGILIYGELADGKLANVSLELLGAGRKLAEEINEDVVIALIGNEIGDAAKESISFGANKVYVVDQPLFKKYQTDSYVSAMEKLCKEINPNILLMGQTSIGRDLAPRLAFKLDTGLATDCIDLTIDPDTKLMLQTRPVYGGNALAVYVCDETKPQMATIRPKVMSPLEQDSSRKGEIIPFDPRVDASVVKAKVTEVVKEEVEGIKLEDADVVVCGGRGIGGPEGFEELGKFAKMLNGAVGATRPPCDDGWVPAHLQVGLTGKMVTPTLYIGVALSGTSQHLAGCSGSKNIVAINKDPDANIFKVAHFGVVSDYKKVLPSLMDKCKELISG
jgi:electron transfer flavoprotein alpha subunit